jgi:hypothetical protein
VIVASVVMVVVMLGVTIGQLEGIVEAKHAAILVLGVLVHGGTHVGCAGKRHVRVRRRRRDRSVVAGVVDFHGAILMGVFMWPVPDREADGSVREGRGIVVVLVVRCSQVFVRGGRDGCRGSSTGGGSHAAGAVETEDSVKAEIR